MRLSARGAPVPLRCALHRTSGEVIEGQIFDLDPFGCRIGLPRDLQFVADERVKLDLWLTHARPASVEGMVRHTETALGPGFLSAQMAAGIGFLEGQWDEQARIREFVFPRMNPEIRLYEPPDYEGLVSLLGRAEYFDYFGKRDHQEFIRESAETYRELPHLYPTLARTTILNDGSKVIGTHSFYRLNKHTWQLHQLVVDPSISEYLQKVPTKLILKSSLEYLCADPAISYFVTYFHDHAAIARAYFEARQSHYNARDYAFIPFRMLLFEDLEKLPLHPEEGSCAEASAEEVPLLSEYLASIVPAIEFDALDFGDPLLRDFDSWWKAKPLRRERRVLVKRSRKGEILCFALANIAPKGLNLIGSLDNFRIFDVPWCRTETAEARRVLVHYVLRFFGQQKRKRIYFEAEEGTSSDFGFLPVMDLGKNWRLIAHRNCFMSALQFFLARFGKLEERLGRAATPLRS